MKRYNVAIVGATGMVGSAFVEILEERDFPVADLRLLASQRSAGETMEFRDDELPVDVLSKDAFEGIDFALFSAGADISKKFAPIAAQAGAVVIDNSSAFRMDPKTSLVVPEVNAHAAKSHNGIIANPNCSTIQMVVAAQPLQEAATIKRIVVSTYQAVSGAGKDAVDELRQQTEALLSGGKIRRSVMPYQIAFNLIPQIDVFLDNGNTKEEQKMIDETRKIMELPELPVSATCVRAPVFNSHSVSLNIEFESALDPDDAREILMNAPGIIVLDEPDENLYPTPYQVSDHDEVFVGRIRKDESVKHGLNMWVVADNLRKGAALNAIQIAELLV